MNSSSLLVYMFDKKKLLLCCQKSGNVCSAVSKIMITNIIYSTNKNRSRYIDTTVESHIEKGILVG